MTRARLVGVSVLLALGALLSLWVLRGNRDVSNTDPSGVVQGTRKPTPRLAPRRDLVEAPATAVGVRAGSPGSAVEPAKFEEPRTPIERSALSSDDPGPGPYLEQYRGRSGRLSPHANPDATSAPTENTSASKEPELVVWAVSTRVTAGQPGSIRAALRDSSGQPLAAERIELTRLGSDSRPLGAPAAMQAQTAGAGSVQEYAAELPTSAPSDATGPAQPPVEYRFVVHASGTLRGQPYERRAGGFFYAQHAGARLDQSSASTSFDHGNLELALQLTIEQPGKYFVSAELWGGREGDRPIAFAREQLGQLSAGPRSVTLLFGGQVIRDAGVDGPYTVRNVQLLRVDAIPPHAAEPIASMPPTRDYRSGDFY